MEKNEGLTLSKRSIMALILASCLIAGIFAYLYIDLSHKIESLSSTSGVFTPISLSPEEIYDAAASSIVLVSADYVLSEKEGSGFLYGKEGYVITVYSLVANAYKIRIIFDNKTEAEAEVVGFDEYSNLAVLKAAGNVSISQPSLLLGDSRQLRLTEKIYIIGKLFGTENSMISGEINGLNLLWLKNEFPLVDVIKFTANAISPETLGAPLLNSKGEVVGMIIDLLSDGNVSTLGYALSSKMMKKIVSSIIKDGKYAHPWLDGVWGIDMSPKIAEYMKVNFTRGFLITYVNSSVDVQKSLRAGNKTVLIDGRKIAVGGDIIIKVDGFEVAGLYDIIAYLEDNKKIGDKVKLTIVRDGEILSSILWPVDAFKPPPS